MLPVILFVDDDPNVLNGLRRMLAPQRERWNMLFATDGADALRIVSTTPVDVIVADIRMPGMDGATLLRHVRNTHPSTLRLVLSGYTEETSHLHTASLAHQSLAKPCDATQLVPVLEDALRLRPLLSDDDLYGRLSRLDGLPALPESLREVIAELDSHAPSLRRLGALVQNDMTLSANLLRLVNSAFYGFARRISMPEQAVVLLGVRALRSLVLAAHLFDSLGGALTGKMSVRALWEHGVRTAGLAQGIAAQAGLPQETRDHALAGGLLHDVGKIALATLIPDRVNAILERVNAGEGTFFEVEQAHHKATHADVGAYLLGTWGLPVPVVAAIARHHTPQGAETELGPVTIVHVANALDHLLQQPGAAEALLMDSDTPPVMPGCDMGHLAGLGVRDAMPAWVAVARSRMQNASAS